MWRIASSATSPRPIYFEEAVALREKGLEPQHPNLAASLNALGSVVKDQGRYRLAETFHRRALSIHETSGHPDVATSLDGLAQVYQAEGRLADRGRSSNACSRCGSVRAIRETLCGPRTIWATF